MIFKTARDQRPSKTCKPLAEQKALDPAQYQAVRQLYQEILKLIHKLATLPGDPTTVSHAPSLERSDSDI